MWYRQHLASDAVTEFDSKWGQTGCNLKVIASHLHLQVPNYVYTAQMAQSACRSCADAAPAGNHWPSKPALFHWQSIRPMRGCISYISSWKLQMGIGPSKYGRAIRPEGAYVALVAPRGRRSRAKHVQNLALLDGAVFGDTCRSFQPLRKLDPGGSHVCQKGKKSRPCRD